MPLMRFDLIEGRSQQEVKKLLDAAHRAMVRAFGVPERDRYQIVHEHAPGHMIVEDTGLDIPRTRSVVVVTVNSRPRTTEAKQQFYAELCRELKESCGIESNDVMVNIMTNTDADWSFGFGRAQFLTGEL
jgi:phenylpyruvate tautomerase PptA (4-oxalocrotonate tautomerase family)